MFLDWMIFILLILSVLSGGVVLFGNGKWERFLGYAMVSAKVNMLIILWALATDKTFYLDIALVFLMLGYVGIIVLAKYMTQSPQKFSSKKRNKAFKGGKVRD